MNPKWKCYIPGNSQLGEHMKTAAPLEIAPVFRFHFTVIAVKARQLKNCKNKWCIYKQYKQSDFISELLDKSA